MNSNFQCSGTNSFTILRTANFVFKTRKKSTHWLLIHGSFYDSIEFQFLLTKNTCRTSINIHHCMTVNECTFHFNESVQIKKTVTLEPMSNHPPAKNVKKLSVGLKFFEMVLALLILNRKRIFHFEELFVHPQLKDKTSQVKSRSY